MRRGNLIALIVLASCTPEGASPEWSADLDLGHVAVGSDGLTVETRDEVVSLSTSAWGRSTPARGSARERWALVDGLLQQSWTLDPSPDGDGVVTIDIAVTGATARLGHGAIELETDGGERWQYDELYAWDDEDRPLTAWLGVTDQGIRVFVDDDGATWPLHVDPLLTTPTVLSQVSTNFGIAASLGDVDADGYADVLVGARFGTASFGEAFSFHGGPTGLDNTPETDWSDPEYYSKFGEYVENAGDLNGDGYADAVVMAPYAYNSAKVYLGSGAGLAATEVVSMYAGALPREVSAIFDYDGDGDDEFAIVDAYFNDIYYFAGAPGGPSATPTILPAAGSAFAGVGDVDGDGRGDLVVGDPGANAGAGAVKLYAGGATPTLVGTLDGAGTVGLGAAIGGRGDVNGDGYTDVLVGEPGYDGGAGRAWVFYGSAGGLSLGSATALTSALAGAGFGTRVVSAGDTNGDGYDDVAVAYHYYTGGFSLFHGGPAGVESTPVNTVGVGAGTFGFAIAGGGDVDGDGFDDVVVGDFGADSASVYLGCADADSDGYCIDLDCDDTDPARSPAVGEVCDGVDNDCDGVADDAASDLVTWYRDADGDGHGGPQTTAACSAPPGYLATRTDCDDTDAATNPDAVEVCNGVDDDCDELRDDADPSVTGAPSWYADADADGYGGTSSVLACAQPPGHLATSTDCDDASDVIHPGAPEATGDEVDSDCDGLETCFVDGDDDGHAIPSEVASADEDCADPGEATAGDPDDDCDDSDATVYPGAEELVDGRDNDCVNGDPDGDGLDDLTEEGLGTDPNDADSDGGGVRDGEEVDRGTDPLDGSDDLPATGDDDDDDTTPPGDDDDAPPGDDDDDMVPSDEGKGGCGCDAGAGGPSLAWLLTALPILVRRRTRSSAP